LSDPQAYGTALQNGDVAAAEKLAAGWIYRGYTMTAFSTKEEKEEEPGGRDVLKGYVRWYPDEALEHAGGKVLVRGLPWKNNVVQTGELITGQNPFSDKVLAATFVKAIESRLKSRR
jgi:putative intracellular protease/amidase